MWSHYAREHSGAVLEFASSPQGNSVFDLAGRVIYSTSMPRLMTQEDIIRVFSGQSRMDAKALMRNSIFVKAMDWFYEKEWRIWLPGKEPDRDFVDLPFDRINLVGVYTGCRIAAKDQEALASIVKENFAHASLYSGHKSAREFGLRFERIG